MAARLHDNRERWDIHNMVIEKNTVSLPNMRHRKVTWVIDSSLRIFLGLMSELVCL